MRYLFVLISAFFCPVSNAQIYHVQEMSTTQLSVLNRDSTVVLLPGGILEEHGPYLPAYTDGYLNEAMTTAIANSIVKRKGMKVLIFPVLPLGTGGANEIPRKFVFSGTYAVRMNTLRSVLMDWASELGDQGFKKIFVINMHGAPNHNLAIDQACEYFNEMYKGRMVNTWNIGFDVEGNFLTTAQRAEEGYTVHAGTSEHSMLYYIQPRFQVLPYKKAITERASGPSDLLRVSSAEGWPGYWGSPRQSNIVIGKKMWSAWTSHVVAQVNAVLDNTYDFNRPTFYQLMNGNKDQNAVNDDAIRHDKEKADKQRQWLKSKGIDTDN